MAKRRDRNHTAEYRHRIAQGMARGLTRSQARGHRRAAEAIVAKSRKQRALEDAKLQMGLRYLRKEKNFTKAAKEAHVSPERLRTVAIEKGIVEKRGRRWTIKRDLPRRVLVLADGRERTITVPNFKTASVVGKHWSAIGSFVRTADVAFLRPFIGKTVTDMSGKSYVLETRTNVVLRHAHAGGSSFEQTYRIVV